MALAKYLIEYRDKDDPGFPPSTMVMRAHSAEHAQERFYDDDDTGWEIISIKRQKVA